MVAILGFTKPHGNGYLWVDSGAEFDLEVQHVPRMYRVRYTEENGQVITKDIHRHEFVLKQPGMMNVFGNRDLRKYILSFDNVLLGLSTKLVFRKP